MTYEEVLQNARTCVGDICKACPVCNGKACGGRIPGPGAKGTGTVEARLEAMEQEVFNCKGMVERGLNANHLMITEFTHGLKVDGRSMKGVVFTFNE